jgi:hypothetical protein
VRALARGEAHLSQSLVRKGLPPTVLWIVKLAVFAAVLSVSVALAVLVGMLVIAAKVISRADLSPPDNQPDWRIGLMGFGLYDRSSGDRLDSHDSDGHD